MNKGFYFGFDQSELTAEVVKYKDAVKMHTAMREASGGGSVNSGNINGESVSYSIPAGLSSFEEWRSELQSAQAQLDGATNESSVDRTVGGFC